MNMEENMAEIMKEQAQEASVLDALLGATVPNVEKDLPRRAIRWTA